MKPGSTTTSEIVRHESHSATLVRVALIIPAFNEADSIEKLLLEVDQLRWSMQKEWRVDTFVVNDASTDSTLDELKRLSHRHAFHLIDLPINLGIGGAVQAGFSAAFGSKFDVYVQLDGDGQHPPRELTRVVKRLLVSGSDMVVASRYVDGAGGNVSSASRQIGTLYFSWLVRVLSGARVKDTTSGFRAYGHLAAAFVAQRYPDDYPEVEALVSLSRYGFKIEECAVEMREREAGVSSIGGWKPYYYMLKVTLATLMSRLRRLEPIEKGDG